jgi:hypothetical protein
MHLFAESKPVEKRARSKKNDKYSHLERIERYCIACREYLEDVTHSTAEGAEKKNLLSRTFVTSDEKDVLKEIDCNGYAELVYNAMVDSFFTEDEEKIRSILDVDKDKNKRISSDALAEDESDEEQKPKKLSAKERRERLLENAKTAMESLKGFYLNGKEQIGARKHELEDRMNQDSDTDPLSLVASIQKHGGEYVHPTFALMKLCNLFLIIKGYTAYDMNHMEKLESEEIPE